MINERAYTLFTLSGNDIATGTTNFRVDAGRPPEVVESARAKPRTDIERDTNAWQENQEIGVEEPAVGVDLLLVLLFDAEDDLHRNDTLLWAVDLVRLCHRDRFMPNEMEKMTMISHVL